MNFERFAEMHGLIIQSLTLDKWVRVSTTSHPHKRTNEECRQSKSYKVEELLDIAA